MPDHRLGEKPVPDIQPKSLLTQLHVISSCPVTGHARKEISTFPSTSTCEDTEDPSLSDKEEKETNSLSNN